MAKNLKNKESGIVLRFGRLKGYGFIKAKNIDEQIFVHHNDIITSNKFRTLQENDVVEFDYDSVEKKAYCVRVLERGKSGKS